MKTFPEKGSEKVCLIVTSHQTSTPTPIKTGKDKIMQEKYLLAVGLLTVTTGANAYETPSDIDRPLDDQPLLNEGYSKDPLLLATRRIHPVVPVINTQNPPEFSPTNFNNPSSTVQPIFNNNAQPTYSNNTVKSNLTHSTPQSTTQLYAQRITALKSGQLYTRLNSTQYRSIWSKATQKPTYQQWKLLLAQEAKAISKGQGNNQLNLLLGDSISQWFPNENLPQGKFWLNQGISGENTTQILNRLASLKDIRPTTIYIMAGVNDIRQGKSDQAILNNFRLMLRNLYKSHPHANIVVQSILPSRWSNVPNNRVEQLNQQLMSVAYQEGADFLNLFSLFLDDKGLLRSDLTTDGLHLNREGYKVWQEALNQSETWLADNR